MKNIVQKLMNILLVLFSISLIGVGVIMGSIALAIVVKIFLNVVLIALSIGIVSFISDIIERKFQPYKYWQLALRELLQFSIFLVVMVIVVSISYWLFILV